MERARQLFIGGVQKRLFCVEVINSNYSIILGNKNVQMKSHKGKYAYVWIFYFYFSQDCLNYFCAHWNDIFTILYTYLTPYFICYIICCFHE